MGLTRPINALMVCAAFAFIAALIIGVLPDRRDGGSSPKAGNEFWKGRASCPAFLLG